MSCDEAKLRLGGLLGGGHCMARVPFVLLFVLLIFSAAHASEPWTGKWTVTWPGGGALIELKQTGPDVSGTYQNSLDSIEALATGNRLSGSIIHGGSREEFHAILGEDQKNFSGFNAAGEWFSGVRMSDDQTLWPDTALDLTSPRSAMRSFLEAGNLARGGAVHALSAAIEAINFGSETGLVSREAKLLAAERLFDFVDLATFSLSEIPRETSSSRLTISLNRLDTGGTIDLDLARRETGSWRIVMPSDEMLLKMGGRQESRPKDAFRLLQSPRDSLRSFLEGMARWDNGGDRQAMSVLDLSSVPDFICPASALVRQIG
jgi:hypothetical protein